MCRPMTYFVQHKVSGLYLTGYGDFDWLRNATCFDTVTAAQRCIEALALDAVVRPDPRLDDQGWSYVEWRQRALDAGNV